MGFASIVRLSRPWYWLPAISSAIAGAAPAGGNWMKWLSLIGLPSIVCCVAEVVNDICDVEVDRLSVRRRVYGLAISGGTGELLNTGASVGQLVYGVAALGLAGGLWAASIGLDVTCIYAAGLLVAVAYSVRPVYLKNRGVLGVLAQGLGYGPIACYLGARITGAPVGWVTFEKASLIGAWVAVVGMTADLLDLRDDEVNNVSTFCVRQGHRAIALMITVGGTGLLAIVYQLKTQPTTAFKLLLAAVVLLFGPITLLLWRKTANEELNPKLHLLTLATEVLFPFLTC